MNPSSTSARQAAATLWQLALAQPQLLVGHVAAYASLARSEAGASATLLQRRAWLAAAAWGGLLVSAVLTGAALMAWATVPAGVLEHVWSLLLVPVLPLLGSAWALGALRRVPPMPLWQSLHEQVLADIELLSHHER